MGLVKLAVRAVNILLRPLGIRIARPAPRLRTAADLLDGVEWPVGRRPFVVDIGAATGGFAEQVLRRAPEADILCVEPIPRHLPALTQRFAGRSVKVVSAAVGDHDGEAEFHESAAPDSSSLLPMGEHARHFPEESAAAGSYRVRVRTLDGLLAEAGSPPPDLLKIDVQGHELAVLTGARRTLAASRYLLIEMSLRPLYRGQPCFEDAVSALRAAGFRMIDYAEGARSHADGELLQMDFLCRRQDEGPART